MTNLIRCEIEEIGTTEEVHISFNVLGIKVSIGSIDKHTIQDVISDIDVIKTKLTETKKFLK